MYILYRFNYAFRSISRILLSTFNDNMLFQYKSMGLETTKNIEKSVIEDYLK